MQLLLLPLLKLSIASAIAVSVLAPALACQSAPIPSIITATDAARLTAAADSADVTPIPDAVGFWGGLAIMAGLDNANKMIGKEGKVKNSNNAPGYPEGGQAATSAESVRNGEAVRTSAVGAGDETIFLGPAVLYPDSSPVLVAQKLMHEGLRCKLTITTTMAAALPGANQGPGPAAPPGERCRWLKNEIFILLVDEMYFAAASQRATAAGNSNAAADFDRRRKQRENKRVALQQEYEREC